MRRLIDRFFPMSVKKSVIVTSTGVLTVTVTPSPPKGYLGTTFSMTVSWTPISPVPPGANVTMTFGDGTSASMEGGSPMTFTKKYAAAGTYSVTATVLDYVSGASGTGSTSVQVATDLVTTFAANPTSGAIPLTVTFTFSMSGGFTPYTWSLDPGDGSTPYSNPASPKSHTYNKVGTFTATLNVSDALGGSTSGQATVGAGVLILFPKLRETFPRIFERIDQARERVREITPTIPAPS